jgi:hypothetical protein
MILLRKTTDCLGETPDMKIFEWRKKRWYRQAIFVLTIVLIVVFAAHPELRLLLPLVDSLGLDLLLLLVSAQFMDYARPLLHTAHHAVVRPVAKRSYSLAIYFLGIIGPCLEARVSVFRLSRGTVA